MRKSPEFRADRLAWRFRKSGGDGRTCREFRSHPRETRERLRTIAGLSEFEFPAIADFRGDDCWLVITGRRLLWHQDGRKNQVELTSLADVSVEGTALRAAGNKAALARLRLVARTGVQDEIDVEPGRPLIGVWNALKMAASWNS